MHPCCQISVSSDVMNSSKRLLVGVVFTCLAFASPQAALAQKASEATNVPDFAPAMIDHMQKMRRYKDVDHGRDHMPPVIDRFRVDVDPKGAIASFQPNGATITANNAFFKDMGTNGRTCFTRKQLGYQRQRCRRAFREKSRYRSDLPSGRWRHLSNRRCLDPPGQAPCL